MAPWAGALFCPCPPGCPGAPSSREPLVSSTSTSAAPVTVTVARRVAPGAERPFEQWAGGVLRAAARFSGFLGGGLLRPPAPGQDWHIVYRFASDAQLRQWEASRERAGWLERAEPLASERAVHRTSGLETWFELPGRTAPAPPRWKMAVVTVTAIVPLVLLMNLLVLPRLADWPLLLRTLVFSGTLTTLMTWVVMPRMTRIFSRFLYGRR